jgi:hypothetical protein
MVNAAVASRWRQLGSLEIADPLDVMHGSLHRLVKPAPRLAAGLAAARRV